ncbi:MAG: response regulator [Chitinispirillaceae bacterium]|nr:response regulator [Chitinispirillaceae bacterium]
MYLPATHETAPENAQTPDRHKGTGIFIIVDDEDVMRDMTGEMLEKFGYTVIREVECHGAVECFRNLVDDGRDCAGMIFDLTIPGGMGGLEGGREIRKIDRAIPVFATRGYTDDPVMVEPEKYGFTASISKPFVKSELAAMFNTHMP